MTDEATEGTGRWDRLEQAFMEIVAGDRDLASAAEKHGLGSEEIRQLQLLLAEDRAAPLAETPPIAFHPEEAVASAAPPDVPGYSVYESLGAGGMGVVFRAIQQSTGQTVAIKVIRRERAHVDWFRWFERETAILTRARHAHIVKVLDAGRTDRGEPFLAMEFVEGALPIDEWVETRNANAQERLAIFDQVMGAIGHLHHLGILHRDLKPSNVLVDRQGQAKIIDFGIAVPQSSPETTRQIGTPGYMSPESSATRAAVAADTRADIFSLGRILRDLFTKRPDAGGGSSEEGGSWVPVPSIGRSRALVGIVEKACSRAPEHRYQHVEDLRDDLERLRDWRPVRAIASGVPVRMALLARRSPVGTIALVLAVALIILIPWMSIEAARVARKEASQAARLNGWLESALFGIIDQEHRVRDYGPGTDWLDRQAMSAPIGPEGSDEDRLFYADLLVVLAQAQVRSRGAVEAVAMLEEAMGIQERLLGPNHPRIVRTRARLLEAVAATGSRRALETKTREIIGDRTVDEFLASEDVAGIFSPTAGGGRPDFEFDSGLEIELDAFIPVRNEDLVRFDYDTRFGRINGLDALGRSAESEAELIQWLGEMLDGGGDDVACRVAYRSFSLDRTAEEVIDRYQGWIDAGLPDRDTEHVLPLALAFYLDRWFDEDADVITMPSGLPASQSAGTSDLISRLLLIQWWTDPPTNQAARVRGLTALIRITDFLRRGEVWDDAMQADLECWRIVGREVAGLKVEDLAARVLETDGWVTNGRTSGDYARAWYLAAEFAVVNVGPWGDPEEFAAWAANLPTTLAAEFTFQEHESLSNLVEEWFGRFCVALCDSGLGDDRGRILAVHNLAVALDDESSSDERLSLYRRAFEESARGLGADDELTLYLGLRLLSELAIEGLDDAYLDFAEELLADFPMLEWVLGIPSNEIDDLN